MPTPIANAAALIADAAANLGTQPQLFQILDNVSGDAFWLSTSALTDASLAGLTDITATAFAHGSFKADYSYGAATSIKAAGPRVGIIGDSRSDNGLTAQSPGLGRSSGVPMATRLNGIVGWLMHETGYPGDIVGQWTLGGCKSSQMYHDAALAVMDARNIDILFLMDPTNDPVDYSGTGGLTPIPLGDMAANPATQGRVGASEPVPGVTDQGTSIGNTDKVIRWAEARGILVVLICIPTENAGRRSTNRNMYSWARAQVVAGTYSNLVVPNTYIPMLADPAMYDGPVTGEVVRTDIEAVVGALRAEGDGSGFLHPSPAGARFIAQLAAADLAYQEAMSELTSLLVLPDGTNDASFINANPYLLLGDGSGTLGYPGSQTPFPTGVCVQNWQIGHTVTTGAIAVTVSALPGHGQRISVARTGGVSATTTRAIRFRQANTALTLVLGKKYRTMSRIVIPARPTQDIFGMEMSFVFNEPGMVDNLSNTVAVGNYCSLGSSNPNPFPKDGDTLTMMGVPFEVTQAMIDSATGTVSVAAQGTLLIRDITDTDTDGVIDIDVLFFGVVEA